MNRGHVSETKSKKEFCRNWVWQDSKNKLLYLIPGPRQTMKSQSLVHLYLSN